MTDFSDSIIFRGEPASPAQLGGKARALSELAVHNLPVPDWFVLTPQAFFDSLKASQRPVWETTTHPATLTLMARSLWLSAPLRTALTEALRRLCPHGERVAVRSSAVDEDGARHSFAGQYESFLFVAPEDVPDKVAAVWRSAYSERVLTYREQHNLPLQLPPPAVLIQRMVDARASGVAFGADPVSGRRSVRVVSAVYGLGSALVSGEVDADTYHVDRAGAILRREIARKDRMHGFDPTAESGVGVVEVPFQMSLEPALTDDQVRAVARLAARTSHAFGWPQDVEWAYDGDHLYLLQSRPITTLSDVPDPDGRRIVWDNSNIVESYSGVTTPLTYTFARRAYEAVYREFCRVMRVPEATIEAHDATFATMIGLVRGRVYYNLNNWYRVLAMLPGFKSNRGFMEQMMGVRESLPDEVLADLNHASAGDRLRDGLYFLRTLGALLRSHWTLPKRIDAFNARLDHALDVPQPGLPAMRADELAAYYRSLERQLLRRWDAPLVNDFFAMIFYGLLGRWTKRWIDPTGSLHNDLLSGEGGMISAEPAERIRTMAALAAGDPDLVVQLTSGSPADIRPALGAHPRLQEAYQAYLDRFGDRCLEELKLESPTLHDDPLPLLRAIGHLAQRIEASGEAQAVPEPTVSPRLNAEARVAEALEGRALRRRLYHWALNHARVRVRDRENLRFERTRVFGRVRRLFLELGQRFFADDLLDDPRDVFYLELHELLGFVEGTATTTDLRHLAALRKEVFDTYRTGPAPADRFETVGPVNQGHWFQQDADTTETPVEGEHLQGLACCPGRVRGPVRIVTDPRQAIVRPGEILVAERTDPGWVLLFPACAGLLVERGSLLSHAAIVSRELGLPSIVALTSVTRWLTDGDWVEMDGSTGLVRRIEPPQLPESASQATA